MFSSEHDDDVGDEELAPREGASAHERGLAMDQVYRARRSITMDTSRIRRFRFRPNALHAIARFLVPGQLWIVAAGTGIGKTTSLLSWADDFVLQGARVAYLGLEMEDFELRTAYACLRAQVPRWVAVENSWSEQLDGAAMFDRVQQHLSAQQVPPLVDQLLFLPHRYIDAAVLKQAAKEAADFGADILIVDHINHVRAGSLNEFTAIVQLSKKVAEDYGFVNLSAAQMNRDAVRGGHRLTRYQPMQLQHIYGGGVIEQNAVVVLNPYRPIVTGADETTKRLVKLAMNGDIEPTFVLQKDRMGIAVLKHRIRGDMDGQRCTLKLEHGKLVDL